ncbi:MAG: hypothetical protein CL428_00090 [Acidimicrobiaceae bacterium]|nr:hypothetical protein [Acidimicrobiaceae bacterium]|tara:strand:+ start:100 stop:543 length:444 start_codon:yes stop_codon:yes gene_type:complete
MKIKSIKYIKYPVILICLTICISGVRWLVSSEPWMLDQLANEERLKMSFTELFLIEGNSTLAEYLTQIYRFLGLYVLGTGLTFLLLMSDDFFKNTKFIKRLLIILGILLFSNLILAYVWIPASHFIFLMWGAILLYLFSIYNFLNNR